MRMLFEIDLKDYDMSGSICRRPSARGIIIKGKKIAMVHSKKFDYYKFPGGGIENGELPEAAMVREVLEETGLSVLPGSIREYGLVHRIQKGTREDVFIQDNYYYLCDAEEHIGVQKLDGYEAEEGFSLAYVTPQFAIAKNRESTADEFAGKMLYRDTRVLEMLLSEGYLGNSSDNNVMMPGAKA